MLCDPSVHCGLLAETHVHKINEETPREQVGGMLLYVFYRRCPLGGILSICETPEQCEPHPQSGER